MPAAAVIPALVAYFDIVAVKTLVVDVEGRGEAREGLTTGLRESVAPARRPLLGLVSLNARRCIHLPRQPPGGGPGRKKTQPFFGLSTHSCTLKKSACSKQATCLLECLSMGY